MVVGFGGGGGLEPRLSPCSMEELDAVDVVSCALAVVSSGFNALAPDSILAATAPVTWPWVIHEQLFVVFFAGGIWRVPFKLLISSSRREESSVGSLVVSTIPNRKKSGGRSSLKLAR